jgi:outer membrane receptor for ferrienterochelin and colicins
MIMQSLHRLPTRLRHLAATVLCLASALAIAQGQPTPPDDPGARAPKKLEKIEVTGPNEVDERRESTAAKIVVNRDEILRYGDTTVLEVMKRLPGVTVGGSGGRGSDIRMRGLGSGYTQILLNGEPMPPGFTLESLAPDLIERIEIYRSATAEFSTQSIAGTINIVLRRAVSQRQRDLKLGIALENGRPSFSATGQVADRAGDLSYTFPLALNTFRFASTSTAEQFGTDAAAAPNLDYVTDGKNTGHGESITLSPKLNWQLAKDHSLTSESFFNYNRFHGEFDEHSITLLGNPPTYASDRLAFAATGSGARSNLVWIRKLGDGARLEAKLGVNQVRRVSEALFDGFDNDGTFILHRTVDSHATSDGLTSSGKYLRPFADHALAMGWEGSLNRRTEDRVQTDISPIGLAPLFLDESYDARVFQLALFAQDEWQVTPRASIYLGLRWEGIDTRSVGNVVAEVRNRSSVLSPIVQALWKLPGTEKDQLRAGLARTYKAPSTFDLMPRRFVANNNTATTPDTQGNPDLRPELAWGLDAAYEHYFAGGGVFSASAFQRRVDNIMLRELLDVNGVFISRPANEGRATIRGIELDAKANLRTFLPSAPSIDLRANVARNVSRVDFLPGPDNRLDQQTRVSGNVGFDYRFTQAPLSTGGNFTFKTGGPVRQSLTQTSYTSARRTLDFYALWKFTPAVQLRLTVSNALAQDYLRADRFMDATGALQLTTLGPTYLRVGATFELKL